MRKYIFFIIFLSISICFINACDDKSDVGKVEVTHMNIESNTYSANIGTMAVDTTVITIRWIDTKSPYTLKLSNDKNNQTVMIPDSSKKIDNNVRAITFSDKQILDYIAQMSMDPTALAKNISPTTLNLTICGRRANGVADSVSASINVSFVKSFDGTKMINTNDNNYYLIKTFTQGQIISTQGIDLSSIWIDPDFFKLNGDGTLTFLPVTGEYKITLNYGYNYLCVEAMKDVSTPASLCSDGSGALWVIGDANIGKPSYSINGVNWSTSKALCMAQVSSGIYQITLVAGQQINTNSINFKFFHQKGWGNEFDGLSTSSYVISTASNVVVIGNKKNGGDNGNIYLIPGVNLQSGATYVFNVDCSKGINAVTLTVTKK